MKIAVATVDGESVSQHFGQSTGFIVFEVEDQQVMSRILRTPGDTPHNEGVCHGQGAGVLGLLQGCNVLIVGGMGGGAECGNSTGPATGRAARRGCGENFPGGKGQQRDGGFLPVRSSPLTAA